jgi:hypothetical protein
MDINFTQINEPVSVQTPEGVKVQTVNEVFNNIVQGLQATPTPTQ